MSSNFNEESHTKGQQFEEYVQNVLFPKSHYELLHKTSDFKQNSFRFVSSALRPDFQFKSLVTGQVFFVEAKYRSKLYNNCYKILSDQQIKRFPKLVKENPIYIALGCGGQANDPELINLIPYYPGINQNITPDKALEFKIDKQAVQASDLPKAMAHFQDIKVNEAKEVPIKKEKSSKAQKPKRVSITTKLIVGLSALILILLTANSYFENKTTSGLTDAEIIRDKVLSYYKTANNYEFDRLQRFYDKNVNWYGAIMDSREVVSLVKTQYKKTPFMQSLVDPESISIIAQTNGEFYATYDMIYKTKQKQSEPYKDYDLKIMSYWSDDYKLKSLSEVRR